MQAIRPRTAPMNISCPDLYAHVETEQRQRNVALWQADVDQRAGETEAVQQAEGKGDDPWPPRGQAWLAAVLAHGHRPFCPAPATGPGPLLMPNTMRTVAVIRAIAG